MKKRVLNVIIPFTFIAFFYSSEKETKKPLILHTPSHEVKIPLDISSTEGSRLPASSTTGNHQKIKRVSSHIKSSDKIIFYNDLPEIRGGLKVVSNIKAIKPSSYNPNLGKIVSTKNDLLFIAIDEKSITDEMANVVYDEKNDRFYPVNAVLKISKANQDLRDELRSLGYDEYYYASNIGNLFIQSSHLSLLDTYRMLLDRGLKIELEIIKSIPKRDRKR